MLDRHLHPKIFWTISSVDSIKRKGRGIRKEKRDISADGGIGVVCCKGWVTT
jgi:hypothetical protein